VNKKLSSHFYKRPKFINMPSLFMVLTIALFGGYLYIHSSNAAVPTTGIKGDVNSDGSVDVVDLSILLSNYKLATTYDRGDLNGSGVVDIFDLSILLANYGKNNPINPGSAGHILYLEKTSPNTDKYTNNPTAATQQWMRDHWDRAYVFSPYWDGKLSWFPNSWVYKDSYAIYTSSALATQHPDWILKDGSGNKLYIPFGCGGGTCPQYAADIGSPAWRQNYIDIAKGLIDQGYKGIFVDDVNMDFRVGNGSGTSVTPIDPRTGVAMTQADWRRYFAEFMEQLRTAIPNAEIIHNAIWYAGGGNHDASDPYIAREIKAADFIDLERGINDSGLTGGTGTFSLGTFFNYVNIVHSYGANVIYQSYAIDLPAMEYNLAGYLLTNSGKDYVTTQGSEAPNNWWPAYDLDLGNAAGNRYIWNGVWRRDFDNGFVLLNEPGSTTKTLSLGSSFINTSGQSVSSITLGATQGAVFHK
jgi:hypothetical protein